MDAVTIAIASLVAAAVMIVGIGVVAYRRLKARDHDESRHTCPCGNTFDSDWRARYQRMHGKHIRVKCPFCAMDEVQRRHGVYLPPIRHDGIQ